MKSSAIRRHFRASCESISDCLEAKGGQFLPAMRLLQLGGWAAAQMVSVLLFPWWIQGAVFAGLYLACVVRDWSHLQGCGSLPVALRRSSLLAPLLSFAFAGSSSSWVTSFVLMILAWVVPFLHRWWVLQQLPPWENPAIQEHSRLPAHVTLAR